MAPCVNICDIDMVVEGLARQAELESQVHSEAREALESCLCCVAREKLKKDPPEEYTVTLCFYHFC